MYTILRNYGKFNIKYKSTNHTNKANAYKLNTCLYQYPLIGRIRINRWGDLNPDISNTQEVHINKLVEKGIQIILLDKENTPIL